MGEPALHSAVELTGHPSQLQTVTMGVFVVGRHWTTVNIHYQGKL